MKLDENIYFAPKWLIFYIVVEIFNNLFNLVSDTILKPFVLYIPFISTKSNLARFQICSIGVSSTHTFYLVACSSGAVPILAKHAFFTSAFFTKF